MNTFQMSSVLEAVQLGQGESRPGVPAAAGSRAGNAGDLTSSGHRHGARGGLRKILVATDLSPSSIRAVEQAAALATQNEATLTLLHVIDINPREAYAHAGDAETLMHGRRVEALKRMDHLIGSLAQERVSAQPLIIEGLPQEEIAEQSRGCDLVVLGQGPAKRRWNLFSKHTIKAVLGAAACPVLVVPAERRG